MAALDDADHHELAVWAAVCAEHVLHLFESESPADLRPRQAIDHARAWARGEVTMTQADAEPAGRRECHWQRDQLPEGIRVLVLDDQRLRNDLCWSARGDSARDPWRIADQGTG